MRVNYERLLGPCLLVVLLAFGDAASVAAQQTGTVTGRVLAETTNRPLAGAQVIVEGLRIGVLAGPDGRYTIPNVPVGSRTIRVEIIGFAAESETVNVTAGGTATLDFTMRETAVSLEEIVVTGTAAEVRAREVGNALDAITSRDIENVPVTNPENIIGGRVPGVTVVQAAGQPGAGGTVRIRGQTTASQTTEPLVYVDGVRVYNLPISLGSASRLSISPLQDIAAADIERVEVIKGASATTLYGTEASGGVIQIFTKRGVSGEPIWNGEISMGLSRMGQVGPDSDPTEIFTRCDVAPEINFGLSQSAARLGEPDYFVDPTCPSNGSWFDDALQQRFALSVRGGSQNVSYYLSSTFNDAEGTLPTQRSRDGGFRGNFDFSPFQPLRVSLNTSYTRRVSRFVEDGNNANGFLLNVGRGTNGNFKGGKGEDCADLPEIIVERPGAPAETVTPICATNGYLFDSENTATSDRYTTGLVLQYEPKQGFSNRFALGWDYLAVESEEWEPWGYLRAPGGFYSSDGQSRSKLSLDYAGSLRNSFGESIVSTFSWGGQIFRDAARRKFVSTRDFAGPGRPTLESGGGGTGVNDSNVEQTNAGFFLQEVVGLNDRLFITGGMRVDGNSAFGDDFGLQFYPKLSAAWIVSDYGFWPEQWFDTFKLRGALGESGKAPGVFDKLRTWTPVTGDESSPGFTPGDIGNSEVGPERTREIEFGFDASLLNGRFGVEATYFSSRTRDALVPVTYPPSEGFLATRIENVGEIKGRGAEFQLSAVLLQSDAFEWRARANLGFNKTEAVDLSGQQLDADLGAGIREGDPFPSYYGVRIMNPDELAEPVLVDDTLIGPVNPTRLIGLSTSFRIGQNILIDALAEHQGGHYLPNYTGYQNARRGVWYPCYDVQAKLIDQFRGNEAAVADVPAVERAKCRLNGISSKPHNSDFWYEKADFWKLRTVALTYNLPQSIVSRFASRASVTLSGSNLFLWTDYDGVDPEVEDFQDRAEGGIFDGATDYGRREYYNIPAPRTYLLSFRVTF